MKQLLGVTAKRLESLGLQQSHERFDQEVQVREWDNKVLQDQQ